MRARLISNHVIPILVKDGHNHVTYSEDHNYDIFDRRIAVTKHSDGDGPAPTTRTWTFYDGDNPYMDFDDQGNIQHYYLYGPDIDQLLARLDPETGNPEWYLTDYLGSVRLIVQDSGNGPEVLDEITYDTFGNVLNETNPAAGDRFKFTARELSAALGLYYYRARWYDPQVGRFLAEDPLSFAAGDANLYRYVFNIPVSLTDPSGQAVPLVLIGIFVIGGGITAGSGIYYGWHHGGPGLFERFIPFWGSGRALGDDLRRGAWGWATVDAVCLGLEFWVFYNLLALPFRPRPPVPSPAPPTPTEGVAANTGRQILRGLIHREIHPTDLAWNKLQHVFHNPTHKHNLEVLVNMFGGEENALRAIHRAAVEAIERNPELIGQLYDEGIKIMVGGFEVTFRGRIVDGWLRVGTAYIPSPSP